MCRYVARSEERRYAYTILVDKAQGKDYLEEEWVDGEINWILNRENTKIKNTFFWNVKPYSLGEVDRCFGETYCLHLQSRRVLAR
jgi:hypothetical protein